MKNQPYNNNPPLLSSPGFGSFKLKQPQSLGAGCSSHGRRIVCSSISPPSTLATLSGYLTGISSFVSQNITASLGRPSGAPTAPENQALSPVNSNNVRDDKLGKAALISASQKEEVVFSKFQWIDWSASQSPRYGMSVTLRPQLKLFRFVTAGALVTDINSSNFIIYLMTMMAVKGEARSRRLAREIWGAPRQAPQGCGGG
ncbi:hypothetical protein BASA60_005623 [Batrachochytrium salamandrivorans]|nr:hypothetical protein BASA60_005623 [Batrachochytrium salamandrivorans]